jgi:hypothetical protein
MSMCVATCEKTAMSGSYAELGGMVSVAVQTVPNALLFPFPLLRRAMTHAAHLVRTGEDCNLMQYTTNWYWKYALLSLAGWVLLFCILALLTNDMSPDAYPFGPSSHFSAP